MAVPDEAPTPPRARPACRREPSTLVLILSGPIGRADFVGLCERVRRLLEGSDAAVVVCDVEAFTRPDAVAVDALARLQLTARRLGGRICIRGAHLELREMLVLTGLSDVVPVEERGKTEQREKPRGVEEERDPADPAV